MKRLRLISLALVLLLSFNTAWAVKLRKDHPNQVIVTKGDTLWDIAGRFLKYPWQWPDIWRANPKIKNPHLIYPGDRIYLTWRADGRPVITNRRGRRISSPIPTVNFRHLKAYLDDLFVLDKHSLDNAGYVVAFSDEGTILGFKGRRVYARNLGGGSNFDILREEKRYKDHETGKALGVSIKHIGTAVLERGGDPASLKITDAHFEVLRGDKLVPRKFAHRFLRKHPGVRKRRVSGSIIDLPDSISGSATYQIVAIDKGAADGLQPGHRLIVEKRKYPVSDYWKSNQTNHNMLTAAEQVTIPEDIVGRIILYRVFDHASYGIISQSIKEIRIGYQVRTY